MTLSKIFSNLIGKLGCLLILHLPFMGKAMRTAASLPSDVFIRAMREKLGSLTDEDLIDSLKKLQSPEGEVEEKMVAYLVDLGVLDEMKQAVEQVIFLREYKKEHSTDD